jgi:hypothetical protein
MKTSTMTRSIARVIGFAALTLILAAGPLTACAKKQIPPGPYKALTQGTLENTDTLVLLDAQLQGMISIEGQRAAYLPDGRLKAEANIRNMVGASNTIQVQTVFKDADNMSSGDETAWQNVILSPNAMQTYSATALNTKSARYTIRVRLPR